MEILEKDKHNNTPFFPHNLSSLHRAASWIWSDWRGILLPTECISEAAQSGANHKTTPKLLLLSQNTSESTWNEFQIKHNFTTCKSYPGLCKMYRMFYGSFMVYLCVLLGRSTYEPCGNAVIHQKGSVSDTQCVVLQRGTDALCGNRGLFCPFQYDPLKQTHITN